MSREAVCVLIRGPAETVLAVSRWFDPEDLGLPGGGVEAIDGDLVTDREGTLRRAAARELREECDVRLEPESLQPVFEGYVGTTRVTTFAPGGEIDLAQVALGLRPEGRVCWSSITSVCEGTYGAYNRALISAVRGEG